MKRERNVSEYFLEIGLKNNLDQNQVANQRYQFIQSNAEVKSVLKSGTITSSNIYVKNRNEKDFVISGNGINFSLDGLGYSNRTRWDFNTVLTEKNVINDFESFFNSICYSI